MTTETILFKAAKDGDLETVKNSLNLIHKNLLRKQPVLYKNIVQNDFSRLLEIAAAYGHFDIAEFVMHRALPSSMCPAFVAASYNGHLEIMKLLICNFEKLFKQIRRIKKTVNNSNLEDQVSVFRISRTGIRMNLFTWASRNTKTNIVFLRNIGEIYSKQEFIIYATKLQHYFHLKDFQKILLNLGSRGLLGRVTAQGTGIMARVIEIVGT